MSYLGQRSSGAEVRSTRALPFWALLGISFTVPCTGHVLTSSVSSPPWGPARLQSKQAQGHWIYAINDKTV